jgi:hypothetical protein
MVERYFCGLGWNDDHRMQRVVDSRLPTSHESVTRIVSWLGPGRRLAIRFVAVQTVPVVTA